MNQFDGLFSLTDLFSVVLWLILLGFLVRFIKASFPSEKLSKYFYPGLAFKIGMALVFSVVYLFIIDGGDVVAYWESAGCLNRLFLSNPSGYLDEVFNSNKLLGITYHFNHETGYPPGWIWRELEAWNAAKLISLISILSFNSFWAATLIIATLAFSISWVLSVWLSDHESFSEKSIAFAFLFFPSVAFWSSGINKDTLIYISALYTIYLLFSILKDYSKWPVRRIFFILISLYILYYLRHFIAIAIVIPFGLALATRYGNSLRGKGFVRIVFISFVYVAALISFFFLFNASQTQALIAEAQITQSDFSNNPLYTGARYELAQTDASLVSFISIFPSALFVSLYRPFITESLSVNFIMNGIESLLLIFYSLTYLFNRKLVANVNKLFTSEFGVYALVFVMIVGFMAGYTSILFGVLVRIRSIVLPFFFLILSYRTSNKILSE